MIVDDVNAELNTETIRLAKFRKSLDDLSKNAIRISRRESTAGGAISEDRDEEAGLMSSEADSVAS